jgi:hypothetical protein
MCQIPYARSQQHLMELVDAVCKNFEDYAQAKTKTSGEPVIIRSELLSVNMVPGTVDYRLNGLVAALWIVDFNRYGTVGTATFTLADRNRIAFRFWIRFQHKMVYRCQIKNYNNFIGYIAASNVNKTRL